MVPPQKRDMLEAFRNAGDGSPQDPGAAAGPFAEPVEPLSAAEEELLEAGPAKVQALPYWAPWAVGVLLAFLLGLAIGRNIDQPTESVAAEGESPAPAERPRFEPTRPANPAPAEASSTDSALYDKENQYTVVVATYGKSRVDFAWATYDHLTDQGLPIFPPVEREKDILILVGAAPRASDLAAVEEKIHGLEGWDGRSDSYADAYVQRIERLLDRSGKR